MKDKALLKLAFLWSLVGIIILICIAFFTEPELVDISELEDEIGKTIIIQGKVIETNYKSKVTFFSINDGTGEVTTVMFDTPSESLEADDKVQVKGKVEYYKGELEIIADEIVCLEC